MRIKLDENVAFSVVARLASLGHDGDTVLDENLGGRWDEDVWTAAQEASRFLITHDLDFSDARRFAPGGHAGILIVRLPDSEQWRVADYLAAWLATPDAASWVGCLVVATPNKVRVRRGPSSRSSAPLE